MPGKKSLKTQVDGRIWLSVDGKPLMGRGRVELLKGIRETGSISRAAKAMKMSYKAAWDAIDAINNACGCEIVQSRPGGTRGGGSSLTPEGERLLSRFDEIEAEHRRWMEDATRRLKPF